MLLIRLRKAFLMTSTSLAASRRLAHSLSAETSLSSSIVSQLRNPSLLQIPKAGDHSFAVFNPAHPSHVLADIGVQDAMDARAAIQRSQDALPAWKDGTTAMQRSEMLLKWSSLILQNEDDIATIMTLESGKPLAESRGELAYGRSFLDFFAGEAVRPGSAGGGFVIPSTFSAGESKGPRGQMMALYEAVGVTGLITPWNFPLAMITRKAGPALAAGCTVVIKPSELTPLTACALQYLAYEAGIPNDVLQLVLTDRESTPAVGKEFCTNPIIRKLSFTGSTTVGKTLMSWSSATMQRLSLELGGNAPFVVFDDADIAQAVTSAIASKFRNSGQTCVCADRFLVHESLQDSFVEALVEKVKLLPVGDGMEAGTKIGPLISEAAAEAVHSKVLAAIGDGASVKLGGDAPNGQFLSPTILTGVDRDSDIWKEETFGPVIALRTFSTEEEALEIANDSRVGLAGYFCTKDMSRVFRFAKSLECGIVGVNEGIVATCAAPFGGVKESGLGREGGTVGISEFLETKYVFMNL